MGKEFAGVDEALADMIDSRETGLGDRKLGGTFNVSAVKREYAAFAQVDISNLPSPGKK